MSQEKTCPARPFDPDCSERVPIEQLLMLMDVVQQVTPRDWDGRNWSIIREQLEGLGKAPEQIKAMTLHDIRMCFMGRPKQILELGGAAETATNVIQTDDADLLAVRRTKSRKMTEPPERMIQAYRLRVLKEMSQQGIADLMSEELKTPVTQPRVSTWIARVKKWLEDGNVLPQIEVPGSDTRPKTVNVPNIELGQDQERRTPRQRRG